MRRWLTLFAIAGCALTSKAPPLDMHYYAPTTEPAEHHEVASSGTKIRLGRVVAGTHLRSRIAYRASPIELDFYETRRWAEPPEAYVRRAVSRALFERGVLVTGGKALQLEVEVVAFEEIRAPRPAGRVALHYVLIDDRNVVGDGLIDITEPASSNFDSLVVAIGRAVEQASTRLVSEVVVAR